MAVVTYTYIDRNNQVQTRTESLDKFISRLQDEIFVQIIGDQLIKLTRNNGTDVELTAAQLLALYDGKRDRIPVTPIYVTLDDDYYVLRDYPFYWPWYWLKPHPLPGPPPRPVPRPPVPEPRPVPIPQPRPIGPVFQPENRANDYFDRMGSILSGRIETPNIGFGRGNIGGGFGGRVGGRH